MGNPEYAPTAWEQILLNAGLTDKVRVGLDSMLEAGVEARNMRWIVRFSDGMEGYTPFRRAPPGEGYRFPSRESAEKHIQQVKQTLHALAYSGDPWSHDLDETRAIMRRTFELDEITAQVYCVLEVVFPDGEIEVPLPHPPAPRPR